MMTITHGTVEFNRRLRTGDYEHKDSKVSLSFTVAEGKDASAIVEQIGNLAVVHALAMVGETEARVYSVAGVTFPSASIMGEAAVAKAEAIQNKGKVDNAQPGADQRPSAVQEEVAQDETITDKRLVDELTAKNARLLNAAADDKIRQTVPQRLHALVASFVPPPGKVQSIPADQRAAFLEQLHAL